MNTYCRLWTFIFAFASGGAATAYGTSASLGTAVFCGLVCLMNCADAICEAIKERK